MNQSSTPTRPEGLPIVALCGGCSDRILLLTTADVTDMGADPPKTYRWSDLPPDRAGRLLLLCTNCMPVAHSLLPKEQEIKMPALRRAVKTLRPK